MRVRRTRRIDAPPDRVWAIAADPWALPRWWPRTQRVEDVSGTGWTSVMATNRGRSVRVDWRVTASQPPMRRRWEQQIAGSPFERLLDSHRVELTLAPGAGATTVGLEIEQDLRGWARLAPFLVRRAARRQADEALAGLAAGF